MSAFCLAKILLERLCVRVTTTHTCNIVVANNLIGVFFGANCWFATYIQFVFRSHLKLTTPLTMMTMTTTTPIFKDRCQLPMSTHWIALIAKYWLSLER